jgi:hypothetical protein
MTTVPVFVSLPSKLNSDQKTVYETIEAALKALRLDPRTVGRSDQALQSPLGRVYQLARRCSGGLILGFRQTAVHDMTQWPGTKLEERRSNKTTYFGSPWNQLEAGILYSLGVPLLVFAEEGIVDGIFERGVGNLFIHEFRCEEFGSAEGDQMNHLIQEWSRHVRNHYMDDNSAWRK